MRILKDKLDRALQEKAEAYENRLKSNMIKDIEDYRNVTGRLQATYDVAQIIEDIYKRIVTNEEDDDA